MVVTASQTSELGAQGSASHTVTKITAIPTVSISASPSITQANHTAYSTYGSCSETGRAVTVTFASSAIFTSICASGTWSLNNIDVSTLTDAEAVALTADHSNSDDVSASQASTAISKDTQSPTITISSASDINASNVSSYQVIGTCSEESQAVTVKIGNIDVASTCTGGAWSTGFQDMSSLDEGSHTVTADHKNAIDEAADTASYAINKATATPTVSALSVPSTLTESAQLSWNLIDPGGFVIEDYTIYYRIENSSTWLPFNDGVSILTSVEVTSLMANTRYEFRVRLLYSEGQMSPWSDVAVGETKPSDPIFDSPYKAMNVGGATDATVVAFEDGTEVTLNGDPIITLNKGETHRFVSAQFDIIDADKAIYTAGRRGSGGNVNKGNITFSPTSWAGKSFSLNSTRYNDQKLAVYAIEDSEIVIYSGSDEVSSLSLAAGTGGVLTWAEYGSFQVSSSGTILAFHYANRIGDYVSDPKPLLPSSLEIIGIPSTSMRLTADQDGTFYNFNHSSSTSGSGSLSRTDSIRINPQGTSTLYQSDSLLISASQKISGASFADANGNCASVFLPTDLMKTKYAINVNSDYVSFASKHEGTIEVYSVGQEVGVDTPVSTITLGRTGSDASTPFKAYMSNPLQGYRFISTVPMAAWYQPNTDAGAATDDETILYGSD